MDKLLAAASKSQSPKKSGSAGGNPLKNALAGRIAEKVVAQRFTKSLLEQKETAELQLLCKEKDVEAEHKLNTLIALNEKLEVFNDLKKDVAENQKLVRESEAKREELQAKLDENAKRIKEDTETKQKYQENLTSTIKQQQDQMNQKEQEKA